jgi:hypothetical protein
MMPTRWALEGKKLHNRNMCNGRIVHFMHVIYKPYLNFLRYMLHFAFCTHDIKLWKIKFNI